MCSVGADSSVVSTRFFGCVRYNTLLKSFRFFFPPCIKEFRIFKDGAIWHCQREPLRAKAFHKLNSKSLWEVEN